MGVYLFFLFTCMSVRFENVISHPEPSPDATPLPPIVFALPSLIIQAEGPEQRLRIPWLHVLHASVCMCVFEVRRGWRLREGGGAVGNRRVLQMLQGRKDLNGKFCGYQRCGGGSGGSGSL